MTAIQSPPLRSPKHAESSIHQLLDSEVLATPCFIYHEGTIHRILDRLTAIQAKADINLLYTLKPFAFLDFLQLISTELSGFAVSSLFEARLAHEAIGKDHTLHFTSPGMRPTEISDLTESCDYISFNSLSQWTRFSSTSSQNSSCGLRINPEFSLVSDSRYDPCQRHSKLGVPIADAVRAIEQSPDEFSVLKGIHFHTNCDSSDFTGILETAHIIDSHLSETMSSLEWINLGGGYIFEDGQSYSGLLDAADLFTSKYNLDVFIEPGAALIREAGFIVSSVLDVFDSGGKTIAVLDTTVNHMPEVFEYRFEPDIANHDNEAIHSYILAGSSCLAGDVFGEYSFNRRLVPGDHVIFENMGAYTLAKAHMFNGIDLPSIYSLTANGELVLKRQFGQLAFADRWRGRIHAFV